MRCYKTPTDAHIPCGTGLPCTLNTCSPAAIQLHIRWKRFLRKICFLHWFKHFCERTMRRKGKTNPSKPRQILDEFICMYAKMVLSKMQCESHRGNELVRFFALSHIVSCDISNEPYYVHSFTKRAYCAYDITFHNSHCKCRERSRLPSPVTKNVWDARISQHPTQEEEQGVETFAKAIFSK